MKPYFFIIAFLLSINSFGQEQFSVFFNSNKFELKKSEILKLNVWIAANNKVKIIGVNGYCDEDGSNGFNDTLAKKRIDYVFEIIKNKIKFRTDFKTRNFGELNNISKIKAENRKVTLFFIQPSDFGRENEIIQNKKDKIINLVPPPITVTKDYKKLKFPKNLFLNNPDGSQYEMRLDSIFMRQINTAKAGEKFTIPNLNFIINTFALVQESRSRLYELLFVLENNPKLKIEFQGHLCCATNDKQDLSTKRAKSIFNFLQKQGIHSSRISYKGFGVAQPIFAIPEKDELERASNRRVEILILEN